MANHTVACNAPFQRRGLLLSLKFQGEIKSLGKSEIRGTRKYLTGRHTMVRGPARIGSSDLKNYPIGQEKALYMTI